MSLVRLWRRYCIRIWRRLKRLISTPVWVWKRKSISCSLPTVRRTSTQRRTSPLCSLQSTKWPKSTICPSFTPAIPAAASVWSRAASCLTSVSSSTNPLGFHDYNCLQMNAFCVVSDSGTLPEESSFFTSVGHPFPAVCIRTSTERPEALDKGDFILAGIDGDHLLQAVDVAVEMNKNRDLGIPVPDYVDENVSDKVVKIIQSYTGVVNKMVWRKY